MTRATTFRVKKIDDEWQVTVNVGGRINHSRTYFAMDKEDAELTMGCMKEEEERRQA